MVKTCYDRVLASSKVGFSVNVFLIWSKILVEHSSIAEMPFIFLMLWLSMHMDT